MIVKIEGLLSNDEFVFRLSKENTNEERINAVRRKLSDLGNEENQPILDCIDEYIFQLLSNNKLKVKKEKPSNNHDSSTKETRTMCSCGFISDSKSISFLFSEV